MLPVLKSGRPLAVFVVVSVSAMLNLACGQRAQPGDNRAKASSEPEQYSATVVRTVEDGTNRETNISHEARAGEQRREEWTENGRKRALIWRPDIGKAFMLDLWARSYVEIDIGGAPLTVSRSGAAKSSAASNKPSSEGLEAKDSAVQMIDEYFSDAQLPTRVETQTLAPATIDGYACDVDQQRATFPDGHTETTRRFQARDLSGLLLRVESEADQGRTRVITERRDIRIGVASDTFTVPADFKRVVVLPR